jgi:dipeptidyl aminopeptidase/acylaminoacyl peptidase
MTLPLLLRFLFLSYLLVLSACTTQMNVDAEQGSTSSSSPSSSTPSLHQSPVSVDDFRTMTLSGTNLVIGQVLEQNSVYAKHYITYNSNGLLISGTFSIPHGDGPYPLIIQNHGYIDPDIYTNGRGLKREQDRLARAGFAVLHTDYRGHAQSDPNPTASGSYENGLGYAVDSANAVLAVREWNDPRIDATRVGMLGHSMGGGVTLQMLVAHPELIDAAVLYAPVNADAWMNFTRWNDDQEYAPITFATFGGTKDEAPEAWAAISPLSSLNKIEDPILLFQGTRDKDVPSAWSDDLHARLVELEKDVQYVVYETEGHEFATNWSSFMNTMIEFFKDKLK